MRARSSTPFSRLGAFVEPLAANGFSVACFDGPAQGASVGRLATIPAMAVALRGVSNALGPVRGIVAAFGRRGRERVAVRQWLLDGFVDLPEADRARRATGQLPRYFERFVEARRPLRSEASALVVGS
jgi:hypothetical protein